MTELLNRVFAIIFLLFGTYIGWWHDDYSRATYYVAFACFFAIAAQAKEGDAPCK